MIEKQAVINEEDSKMHRIKVDGPDKKTGDHYQTGCGCPRCSFIDAVAAWTAEFTGRPARENIARVLADAAQVIAGTRVSYGLCCTVNDTQCICLPGCRCQCKGCHGR